jgi:hypothetical protein
LGGEYLYRFKAISTIVLILQQPYDKPKLMRIFYTKNTTTLFLFLFLSSIVSAQVDTLVMNDGTMLIGEMKDLKQGVIIMETDYSDSDFKIEWDKVKEVNSERSFIITTAKGDRLNGTIKTVPNKPGQVIILDKDIGPVNYDIMDIVFLKSVSETFLSRLDLLLSAGYTLTKANNNHQISGRLNAGYLSNTFGADMYFGIVRSFQTINDTIKTNTSRTEGGLGFRLFIVKDWFAMINNNMLQSTEQQINLRSVTKLGIGNYVVNTNSLYLMLGAGGAWNYEKPEMDTLEVRNNLEGFATISFNMFDMGDLSLKTSYIGFISITDSPRYRSDFNFDLKYDLPLDFFINLGFTLNYDSKPLSGAPKTDYVLQTTIGWEL